MEESEEDLRWLQSVLDASYAAAGDHLRSIHTPAARLSARALTELYTGMQVLVVATVSSRGAPMTGPVDSFLYRGRLHFGTAVTAVRTRHLARTPAVSATHVRGEGVVVTVHGRVRPLELRGADAGFAELTRRHYGAGWDEPFGGSQVAAWAIEPSRMFAADMSVHTEAG